MLSKTLITSACAAAILTVASATPAIAQGGPVDSRTEFTFNQPVEMPGVTLPPGTYIFRFADATSGRKVMQVMAKDSTSKTYGLFMTISAQRPRPSDAAELRFLETPAGQPAAVKTWWYPGNTIGREFIYPKSQARRLAKATNETVLTTQAENVSRDQMQIGGSGVRVANRAGNGADRRSARRRSGEHAARGGSRSVRRPRKPAHGRDGRHAGAQTDGFGADQPAADQHGVAVDGSAGPDFARRCDGVSIPTVILS